MIKNLNQLKRALRPGVRLEVTGHCRPSCIGGHMGQHPGILH